MADKEPVIVDDDNDDTLDLTDKLDDQAQQGDDEADNQSGDDDQQGDDEGEEQPSVSFEGEEPAAAEPESSTIRTMRQQLREKERRIAELEKTSAPKPVEVGPKPGLWDDDIAGDEELYGERLLQWKSDTDAAEAQAQQAQEATRAANESWVTAKQRYETQAAEYGFSDIKDDEAAVDAALGVNSPVILKAANDPALMIRALGQHPAKLAELAKIKDPFELAAAVARMEGAVKVTRKAPAPDRAQRGSAAMPAGGTDKELEKLEKEAEHTGNRTKVIAHKNALKAAAKGK